jgi:hypothetical protein
MRNFISTGSLAMPCRGFHHSGEDDYLLSSGSEGTV